MKPEEEKLAKEMMGDLLKINKKSAWGRAIEILERETGLSIEDLPDGLPIEDFINEDGSLDYDGISNW